MYTIYGIGCSLHLYQKIDLHLSVTGSCVHVHAMHGAWPVDVITDA